MLRPGVDVRRHRGVPAWLTFLALGCSAETRVLPLEDGAVAIVVHLGAGQQATRAELVFSGNPPTKITEESGDGPRTITYFIQAGEIQAANFDAPLKELGLTLSIGMRDCHRCRVPTDEPALQLLAGDTCPIPEFAPAYVDGVPADPSLDPLVERTRKSVSVGLDGPCPCAPPTGAEGHVERRTIWPAPRLLPRGLIAQTPEGAIALFEDRSVALISGDGGIETITLDTEVTAALGLPGKRWLLVQPSDEEAAFFLLTSGQAPVRLRADLEKRFLPLTLVRSGQTDRFYAPGYVTSLSGEQYVIAECSLESDAVRCGTLTVSEVGTAVEVEPGRLLAATEGTIKGVDLTTNGEAEVTHFAASVPRFPQLLATQGRLWHASTYTLSSRPRPAPGGPVDEAWVVDAEFTEPINGLSPADEGADRVRVSFSGSFIELGGGIAPRRREYGEVGLPSETLRLFESIPGWAIAETAGGRLFTRTGTSAFRLVTSEPERERLVGLAPVGDHELLLLGARNIRRIDIEGAWVETASVSWRLGEPFAVKADARTDSVFVASPKGAAVLRNDRLETVLEATLEPRLGLATIPRGLVISTAHGVWIVGGRGTQELSVPTCLEGGSAASVDGLAWVAHGGDNACTPQIARLQPTREGDFRLRKITTSGDDQGLGSSGRLFAQCPDSLVIGRHWGTGVRFEAITPDGSDSSQFDSILLTQQATALPYGIEPVELLTLGSQTLVVSQAKPWPPPTSADFGELDALGTANRRLFLGGRIVGAVTQAGAAFVAFADGRVIRIDVSK
ncbi:MAG: hypothetical protein HY791_27110 [Deltaproteobacteria bacterium]|nr:hypothetical protein [Deltaproteobacteria bacterium]